MHNFRSVNTRHKQVIKFPWLIGAKRNTYYAGLWIGLPIRFTTSYGKRIWWLCVIRA